MKLTNEQLHRAVDIFGELSPENLTCDGELSRSEVLKRHNALVKRLRALEAEVGSKIDELEVYREFDRRRARGEITRSPFGGWL